MRSVMVVAAGPAGGVSVLAQGGDAARVLAGMHKALGGADRDRGGQDADRQRNGHAGHAARHGRERDRAGDRELPDKFMTRTVVAGEGGMAIYRHAGFNGTGPINELDAPPNLNAPDARAARGQRSPARRRHASRRRKRRLPHGSGRSTAAKKEFARLTLGMFASSYAAFPLRVQVRGRSRGGRRHGARARRQRPRGIRRTAVRRHEDQPAPDADLVGAARPGAECADRRASHLLLRLSRRSTA